MRVNRHSGAFQRPAQPSPGPIQACRPYLLTPVTWSFLAPIYLADHRSDDRKIDRAGQGKDFPMARIARAVAFVVLVIAGLGSTGCLHTWTQTYQDYPPSAWEPPHTHPQGDPSDG